MRTLVLLFLLSPFVFYAQQERKVALSEDKSLIEVVYYHDNGAISQMGTYDLNGVLHGKWESYDEKGHKLVMGTYNAGKKDGKWFFWNNELLREVDYNSNAIASVREWQDGEKLALNNK